MPDRVIRDEIARSHRYWKAGGGPIAPGADTLRLLFLHLCLSADDYGNAEAESTVLTILMMRPVDDEQAEAWRTALSASDLARPYQHEEKWYVHIPRFRQRLRALKGRYPQPPELLTDKEYKEIRPFVRQTTDKRQTTAGQLPADDSLARAGGIESNRIESNRSTVATATSAREAIAESSKPIDKNSEVKTESNGHGETAAQARIAELAAKLTKPPSGERHRTRDEQLAAIAALTGKGRS